MRSDRHLKEMASLLSSDEQMARANDYSLTSKSKQTVVDHHLLAILFAQKLKHCGFKFVPVVILLMCVTTQDNFDSC